MIPWWQIKFDEYDIQKITSAIQNKHISQGPETIEFEERLSKALDVPYVLMTTSGSVSMLMVLMALGIKPGDEIIVPNRTWIATAHAPMMLGAKVVLIDVLPDVPVMDVSQLESKITKKTKVIMPVNLSGRNPDLNTIREIGHKHNIHVVEDAAQGLFCKYEDKFCGTRSEAGCFSFSISKLISTGQGGFITTSNPELYQKLRNIRTHGVDNVIDVSYTQMGFNFKYTDLQAAFGLSQLERIWDRIDLINKVYKKYEAALLDLPFLKLVPVKVDQGEIPLYIEVLYPERKKLVDFLASYEIQARPLYPDLNRAEHLKSTNTFPNAQVFGEQTLVLPCGPDQPMENIDRVIETLHLYARQ
jgi:perosamine synthetase